MHYDAAGADDLSKHLSVYPGAAADPIYSAELRFLHQLLEDGATRTTDPYEADLFFVPIFGYYTHSGNMNAPTSAFDKARTCRGRSLIVTINNF